MARAMNKNKNLMYALNSREDMAEERLSNPENECA